jgi:hypothetical protein
MPMISVTVDNKTFNEIEKRRNKIPRATYVRDMTKKGMKI